MERKSINVKLEFHLTEEEKGKVTGIVNKGKKSARVFKRARVLELFDEGLTSPMISRHVGVTAETVRRIGWNYVNEGVERALYDAPRPGTKKKLSHKEETRIVAVVCSDPPEGYDRWSIRLLTEEVKKRKIVDSIGRETIRVILKSHGIKPWREKMWCVAELDEEYIGRMEEILSLYEKNYNEKEPVVCLDEKPVQLLEDMREAKQSANGIKKRDHHYRRKGTANVFCGVEPLQGRYYNYVTENKKSPEFAKVLNRLSSLYSEAEIIHLVMDNYSTHTQKALTDFYGVKKGTEIWNRFAVHYTPKNASWLDQAEIAIGLYSKQCLGNDRIGAIDELRQRTRAWNKAINKKKLKIQWGFTVDKARRIFKYN